MALMTQAEYARHRGVVKSAVSNWKAAGLLVLAEDPADSRIKVDQVRTDARLNARIDPMRGRPSTGQALSAAPADPAQQLPLAETPSAAASASGDRGFAEERVEELRERRIGAALKNAQLAGDLVPLAEAERRVSEAGRAARERMHAWVRGIAERLAATSDVRALMTFCEEGIDQVFAELASAAQRGDFAGEEEDTEITAEEQAEIEAAAAIETAEAEGEPAQ